LAQFTILGTGKKTEIRTEQLKRQREDWKKQAEKEEAKNVTLSSKILYEVSFDFTEADKENAMEKVLTAAIKVSFLVYSYKVSSHIVCILQL
jgi:hypothetical protein